MPITKEEAEIKGWNQYYTNGETVTWWGFTSTATDMGVTKNFISKAAESTLFIIGGADLWDYDIKAFSKYPEETEVLLEPEAKVKVVSDVIPLGSSLIINVELQPFTHLVLEDIIPVGGAKPKPRDSVSAARPSVQHTTSKSPTVKQVMHQKSEPESNSSTLPYPH